MPAALSGGQARALVVNSGNANAFTGKAGREAARFTAKLAAKAVGCKANDVFVASTGVIGEPLDATSSRRRCGTAARVRRRAWQDAARAIMTTDTYPKGATRTAEIDGVTVTINGIAKGAGMIAPDMATMLCFVVTDAPLAAAVLTPLLQKAAGDSFNAITVDSDTSTSDTLLLFATGTAGWRGWRLRPTSGWHHSRRRSPTCSAISRTRLSVTAKGRQVRRSAR